MGGLDGFLKVLLRRGALLIGGLPFISFEAGCYNGVASVTAGYQVENESSKQKSKTPNSEPPGGGGGDAADNLPNPYAGAGKAIEAADISGAWLTRCDLTELGESVGEDHDKILCRVQDPTGLKYDKPVTIEFYDAKNAQVTPLAQRSLQETNYYNIEYKLPNTLPNSLPNPVDFFAWVEPDLNPSKPVSRVNTEIISPTGAVRLTDIIDGQSILGATEGSPFCHPAGILNLTYSRPYQELLATSNVKPVDPTGPGCFRDLQSWSGNTLVRSEILKNISSTGCFLAKYASDRTIPYNQYFIFEKSRFAPTIEKPTDITVEKLRSYLWKHRC